MWCTFISSRKLESGLRLVLWQRDHYFYQIDSQSKTINLHDTSYEDAIKQFSDMTASDWARA